MDISELIEKCGGVAAVARMCGITSQAVSQWKRFPVERCGDIENAMNGAVTKSDMRPDIWPPAQPAPKKKAA